MGKKWKQWQILFDGDYGHEIKRHFHWKKINNKPRQHIKKQTHYLANKYLYSQSYGFSSCHAWMWELHHKESWALKNWCWRRLMWVPWTARRSNQPILKEINPEYSLEGLMMKLKLQCFGHLMQRADSLKKTLMLGKIEGRRRRGRQEEKGKTEDIMVGWHHWLNGHEFEHIPGVSEGQESLACCSQ